MTDTEKSLREMLMHNAQEVDRLRAENERLNGLVRDERIISRGHQAMIESLLAENERLRVERDNAAEEKLDAISTLDAWFDRRKIGHEAVDQAVVDAASGYLRTSCAGGMPKEESDLILGVIQDMARLGRFADLFARVVLKGKSDE